MSEKISNDHKLWAMICLVIVGTVVQIFVSGCGGQRGGVSSSPEAAPTTTTKPPPPRVSTATPILKVDFDSTALGAYTDAAFEKDWPSTEWVSGLDSVRAEIVAGAAAYAGRSLRLKYPANTFGPGAQAIQAWVALPKSYEELFVSYRIRFERGFDFVLGGKLPGLSGGKGNTGGEKPTGLDGWSGRMMWRAGGSAVQYVYHPDQPRHWGQDFPYRRNFSPGQWHTVEHRFVMNTPGEKDGVLQAWFDDDQVLDVDTLRFRDVNAFAIDQFYFSTFFGGDNDTWAPTRDQYITFDDFFIAATRIEQ